MAEAADIKQTIIDAAVEGIQSTIVDGNRVDAKSIAELIAADQYAAAKAASSNPGFGLRFSKGVPPGTL